MMGGTRYHLVTIGGSSSPSKTQVGRSTNMYDPNEIFDSSTLTIRRDWSYYLYTDASTATKFVTFTFTTPTQPSHVHSIWTSLDESLDYVVFSLITTNVKDGKYTLVLKDGSTQVQLETTIVGSAGSVTVLARNASGSAKVKYGTTYELVSLSNSTVSTTPTPIQVTTPPAPRRVVSVSETSGSDSIDLHWTSSNLTPYTSYTVFLSSTSTPSGVAAHTCTLEIFTAVSGGLHDTSVQLYPFDVNKQLEYGTVYSVTRVEETLTSTRIACDAMTITTPSEPSRIEGVESIVLNGAKTKATVTFSGRALKSSMGSIRAKKGVSTWTSLSPLTFVDSTTCRGVFSVGLDQTTSTMKFKEEYVIEGVGSGCVVNSAVSIRIPAAPVLNTLSASLDTSTNHHINVTVSVSEVVVSGVYEAWFTGVLDPFTISLTNGHGTSRLEITMGSRYYFNKTYSLSSLMKREAGKEDEHIVFGERKMTTPEGPTLSSIGLPTLTPSNLNTVDLKLDCFRMPEETFTLAVFDVSDTKKKEIGLSFSFGSPSPTSIVEGTFLVYQSEELKYGRTYEVVRLRSSTISASVRSSTRFTIPPAPCRVESAVCDLLDEKKTSGTVRLTGVAFPGGSSFSVSIQEWDSKSNQAKGSLLVLGGVVSGSGLQTSASVTELIFGNASSKLKYGREYVVSLLTIGSSPTIVNPAVQFRVPAEPSRFTKLRVASYDTLEKTANFVVEGVSMPTNKNLTLSLTPSSSSVVRKIVVLFTTSTLGSGSGILFSENSDEIELDYGTTYEVTQVEDEKNDSLLFVGGLTISTISEPGRVLKVSGVSYSGDMNTTTISLSGHWMETGEFAMEVENTADSTDKAILTASFVSSTEGSSTGSLYPTAELKYGVGYRIVSLEKKVGKNRKVHVEPSARFSIGPRPARLTGLTQNSPSDEEKELRLVLTGIGMTNGPFKIELHPAGSLTATFTDGTTGSTTAILFSTKVEDTKLNYSTRYEVIGVRDSSSAQVAFVSGLWFETGSEPTRLVGISSTLRLNPSQTTVLIPVSGRELKTTEEYLVEVKDTVSPFSVSNLSMSFLSSSSEWIVSGTIFGDSVEIVPLHSYSVIGFFASGSSSPLFFEPISFTVPSEPPRLTKLRVESYESLEKTANFVVEGVSMPTNKNLTLSLTGSSSSTVRKIVVLFTTSTLGSGSGILFSENSDEIELDYGTTYEVTQVEDEKNDSLLFVGGLTISTISEPGRVLKVSGVSYSGDMNTTTISLSGHWMETGEFAMEVENTADSTDKAVVTASFVSSTEGSSTGSLYPTAELKYGVGYRIVSLEKKVGKNRKVHVEPSARFSIGPRPARLTGLTQNSPSDEEKELRLVLTGIGMTNGPFKIELHPAGSLTAAFTDGTTGSSTAILFSTNASVARLNYSTRYEVIGVRDSSSAQVAFVSELWFETGSEPTRLVGISSTLRLNPSQTTVLIPVSGRELKTTEEYLVEVKDTVSPFSVSNLSMSFLSSSSEWIVSGTIFGDSVEIVPLHSYSVIGFFASGSSSPLFFEPISFTVPSEPPRLTKLRVESYESLEKTANFVVEGVSMPTNKNLTLSLTGSSSSTVRKIVVLFTTSTLGSGSGILFSENSDEIELDYGTTYEVTQVEDEKNDSLLFVGGLTISTISEPGRVLKVSGVSYSGDMNTTTISLSGHWMETGEFAMEVENTADSTDKAILTASFVSSTEGSSTGSLYPTAELKYGVGYRIVSLEKKVGKNRKVHVEPSARFSIGPRPARLTGLTQNSPSDEEKELRLVLTGIGMTNGPFKIELHPAGSLTAAFTDGTTGSTTAILFSTKVEDTKLNYSTRYEVIGVRDSSSAQVAFVSGLWFETGSEPTRLVGISSTLRLNPSQTTVLIPVSGRELKTTEEYLVEVKDTVSPFSVSNLSMSFLSSSSEWIVSGTIFGDSVEIVPLHSYSVIGFFASGSSSPLFFEPISFTVPSEPPRLTKLRVESYDSLEKTANLVVEGVSMPTNKNLTLSLTASSSSVIRKIVVLFTTSTLGSGSGILFSENESEIELDYGKTYEVTQVEDENKAELLFVGGLTISTISEPGRVLKVVGVSYSGDMNTTTISLSGHWMETGEFAMEVENTADSTDKAVVTASFVSSTEGSSTGSLYPTAELKYGVGYRIVSLEKKVGKNRKVHVEPSARFSIGPRPARLTGLTQNSPSDEEKELRLVLTGIGMTNGPFKIELHPAGSLTAAFTDGTTGSSTAILFSTNASVARLNYSTRYEVIGVRDSSSGQVAFVSELWFETGSEPTRLVGISSTLRLNPSQTTVLIPVSGRELKTTEEYLVEVKDTVSPFSVSNLSMSFLSSSSEWIVSGTIFGDSVEIVPLHSYSVIGFFASGSSSPLFFEPISFTVPSEPPRLTKLRVESYESLEKTANFVVEGVSMPTNKNLTLSLTGSSSSTVRKIVVLFTTSTLGSGSGILFSENSDEIELDYGTTYEVTQVEDEKNDSLLFVGGLTISTISEPGRVLKVSGVSYSGDMNTTTISLSGHWMETGEFAMEVENTADSTDKAILTASFVSSTEGSSTGSLYPTAELKYGVGYRIVSLEKKVGKNRKVHVEPSARFSIGPRPARLTGLTQNSPSDEEKELRLVLTGIGMTNGPFKIELHPAGSLTAAFTDGTTGSSTAILFSTNASVARLNYSTRYEVIGVRDSSSAQVAFVSGLWFETGSEPTRLVGISSTLRLNPSQTTVLIPVSGRELKTTEEYLVEVKDTVSPFSVSNLSMSFLSSSSEWIVSGTIFGDSVEIVPLHSYSVIGFFASGSSSPLFFEPISFTVPSEPPRLTKLRVESYESLEKTANFVVEGVSMPTNKNLTLSLTGSSSSTVRKIVVLFTTSTLGSGSGILFSENSDEIELDYGTTYEVTQVEDEKNDSLLFVGGLTISTISEPGRVLKVSGVSYSGDMNTTTISLSGHWMETGEFAMEVENTADSTDKAILTASFVSSTEGSSTGSLYPTAELKYGVGYRIVSLEKKVGKNRKVHVEPSARFSIGPRPARLTGLTQNSPSDEEKELRLVLTGIGMTNGPFKIELHPAGSLTAAFTDGTTGSSTAILFSTNASVARLNYSTRYEVIGVRDSSSGQVAFVSGLSFETGSEPTRLVGISSTLRLNPSQTTVLIPVSGRELKTTEEYLVEVKDTVSPFSVSNLSMSFLSSSSEWIVSGTIFGDSVEIVPLHSYSVIGFFASGSSSPLFFEPISFTVPSEPPRLTKLRVESYDSLEKTANFVVEGVSMPTNKNLTLSLTGSSSSTVRKIVVLFTTSTLGSGSGILFSENSDEIELDYGTTYEVTQVEDEKNDSLLFVGGLTISTISEPGRVLKVSGVSYSGDMNTTTISLSGHWMETGEFAMEVENTADSTDKAILTASFVSSTEGSSTGSLYPTAELKYGVGYRIVSLEKKVGKNRKVHVEPSARFSIGPRPARLTGLTQNSPSDEEKELRLVLTGIGMTNGPFKIELHPAGSLTAAFTDGTTGSSTAILFSTNASVARLNYSTRYEVIGVRDSSSAQVAFVSELWFETGSEPTRLVGISSTLRLNPSQTTVLIPVSGRELKTTEEYLVEVKDTVSPFSVSNLSMSFLSSSSEWIVSGTIFGDSVEIVPLHSYSVIGFFASGSSSPLFFEPISFTVPSEPPRLTKLRVESYESLEKTANFVVEGVSMPTNKNLTLSLTGSSSSTVRKIVVLFTTSTLGSGSGILFSENSDEIELDYGTTYEVTQVEDEKNDSLLFVGGLTISTISEPGRVLKVSGVSYSGDMNTTTISLSGHWMETGEFAMEVENTADSTDKAILTASFVSSTEGSSTGSLYPTAELKYGVGYRIVSLEKKVGKNRKVHVEPSARFSIGPRPARLTGLTQNSPSDEEKELRLVLTGIGMTNGPFKIELHPAGSLTAAFTDGTTGSSTAILFSTNASVARLNYSTRYEVIGVRDSSSGQVAFVSGLSFETGSEPTRLVGISSTLRLNPSQTTVLIPVSGRELKTTEEYLVEVKDTVSPFSVSNLSMSFSSSSSEWIVSGVIFGDSVEIVPLHSYSVIGFFASGSSSPLFFEPISFTVPETPFIASISATFTSALNASIILSLSGTNLLMDSTFLIHLVNSAQTIPVTFTSETSGSSSPISLIRQPGLPYATMFKISKISSVANPTLEIPISSKTFGPFTAPTELFLFSDSSGSTDESLFGGEDFPARSLGLLFDVVKRLTLKRLTISTVNSTILEKGLDFRSMRVKLTDSVTSHPTIKVKPENGVAWMLRGNGRLELESLTIVGSSELKAKGSGLVWMDGGSIEMSKVILKLLETSSPILELSSLSHASLSETSFSGSIESVFAKVSDTANMTLSSCTFLGPSTSSTSLSSSYSQSNTEDMCSWTGAVIQTSNSNLYLFSSHFSHLRQGSIETVDGRVEVFGSSFQKNFASFEAFPSFRRNIRCSGNGEVVIESLSGGDGTKEHRNGWIVLEENCTIETDDIAADSVFFSPELTPNEKKAEWNKKTKTFKLGLKGEFLIPCGLSLEVFSIEEKIEKSKMTIPLSSSNTGDWTESSMTITLSEEKLSQLESKLEWRTRLVFGSDDRTSTSVMLKLSSSDERKSLLSLHKNWLLPLIISLSVLLVAFFVILVSVLVCRRNKKQNAEKLSAQKKELNETDIAFKMEIIDNEIRYYQDHSTSANLVKAPDNAFDHAKSMDDLRPERGRLDPTGLVDTRKVMRFGDEKETTIIFTNDTLFNRLHRQQVKLMKDEKQRMSIELAKLAERMRQNVENFTALSRISPHTILLDRENTVMLQTEEKAADPTQNSTQSFLALKPLGEGHEGKRWQAPEIYEGKEKVSAEKAAVFSLGLILWELETESVPFGEVDSTNAQRLLGTGFQPFADRSVGVELMIIIEKCLSLKPDDRPTLQDLITSLESSSLFSDNQTQQNQVDLNA
ncbi:hypothetical protein BLNAU_6648 [Blattamonas nauphoetae]|uniref:Protein kinase domain-containing protein n=1 Tax=Blattamonas nauphoetae TaxID=2049346 RepID=A0ABQ9Y3Q1_9EUKA|nr:hypothetical protein BLNAU_6648 [Blattamonas nauphoetae]